MTNDAQGHIMAPVKLYHSPRQLATSSVSPQSVVRLATLLILEVFSEDIPCAVSLVTHKAIFSLM